MDIVNAIIDGLTSVAKGVVNLLPHSPFQAYLSLGLDSQLMRWLNWLVPVGQMVTILELWVVAIGFWYGLQIIFRWAKLIE